MNIKTVSIEEVIYHKNDDPTWRSTFMYHPDTVYTDDFYNSEFNYFINNNVPISTIRCLLTSIYII